MVWAHLSFTDVLLVHLFNAVEVWKMFEWNVLGMGFTHNLREWNVTMFMCGTYNMFIILVGRAVTLPSFIFLII